MKLRIFIFLILLVSKPVGAVVLEQLQTDSYLNEPLKASIEIHGVDELDLADIKFSVASNSDYIRLVDTNRPAYLDKVKFKLIATGHERHILQITSLQRVREPILTFLLKVTEKHGSFIKKFTLLLDP